MSRAVSDHYPRRHATSDQLPPRRASSDHDPLQRGASDEDPLRRGASDEDPLRRGASDEDPRRRRAASKRPDRSSNAASEHPERSNAASEGGHRRNTASEQGRRRTTATKQARRRQPAVEPIVEHAGVDEFGPPPPPPPQHRWLRGRMQGFSSQINLNMRDDVIESIPRVLKREGGEELLERFYKGPFRWLLEIKRRSSANNALHELLARELTDNDFTDHERLFHIGGRDILFSAREFALVIGLPFGDSDFNPRISHDVPQTSILHMVYNGKRTRVNTLKSDFNDRNHKLGAPEQYLKAANLLMCYCMVWARDNVFIDDWTWALVEDEAWWAAFPWGSLSFQFLCHEMGIVKKDPSEIDNERGAYHFAGPVWALNLWAYEAIPELGKLCGTRRSEGHRPRLRRWATTTSPYDFTCFFTTPQLQVYTILEPDAHEMNEPYYRKSEVALARCSSNHFSTISR